MLKQHIFELGIKVNPFVSKYNRYLMEREGERERGREGRKKEGEKEGRKEKRKERNVFEGIK